MKYLFQEPGWGRQQTPKSKQSDSGPKGRPDFVFDFSPVHGIARKNVERWPIEGFSGQNARIGLSAFASWAKRPLEAVSHHVGGKGLLISGWTHERLRCGQEGVISKLPGQRGRSHDWLQIHYGFPRILNSDYMESSQRSRGWVHVALGLTALSVSNHEILDVCENGIGALNLPTEFSQTGSHTSRAVHPVFLSRIAKAASLLFERQLSIRQSAIFETKGELLKRTFDPEDANLIKASFSCEIFPNYNSKQPQCGVCPSCLVRRSALSFAKLKDPGPQYSFDVLSKVVPAKKALGMIKMERYVRRIETCFGQSARDDAALWEYPEAGSYFAEAAASLNISPDVFLSSIRKLHDSFTKEWKGFSDKLPQRNRITEMAA